MLKNFRHQKRSEFKLKRLIHLIVLAISLLMRYASVAGESGVIRIEPKQQNLGVLYRGQDSLEKQLTFEIKNDSDLEQTILSVKSSCSCAVTKISKSSIPSWSSAFIQVNWDIRRKHGVLDGAIVVHMSNGQILRGRMEASIANLVTTFPFEVNLDAVSKEQVVYVKRVIAIDERTLPTLTISTSAGLSASVKERQVEESRGSSKIVIDSISVKTAKDTLTNETSFIHIIYSDKVNHQIKVTATR